MEDSVKEKINHTRNSIALATETIIGTSLWFSWFLGNFCFFVTKDYRKLEIGDPAQGGGAYATLGNVYQLLRDYRRAIEYHGKHLKIAKDNGDRAGEGAACANPVSYTHLTLPTKLEV